VNLLLRIVGLLGASLPGDLQLCLDQDYGESTGGLSAAALVNMGRATLVIDFLKNVEAAERIATDSCLGRRRSHA
jgi:hypothetical protein